jgi:hypothetical protein
MNISMHFKFVNGVRSMAVRPCECHH